MTHRFMSDKDVKLVLAGAASASGNATCTTINAAGWDRAAFIVNLGAAGAGTFTGQVVEASTSGATMVTRADSPVLANASSGAGANQVQVIDFPIHASNPWLNFSGGWSGAVGYVSIVAVLYRGSRQLPATLSTQQVVEV